MTKIYIANAINNIDYENRPEIFSEMSYIELKRLLKDWFIKQLNGKEIQSKYGMPDRFYAYISLLRFSTEELCPNCSKTMKGHFLTKSSFLNLCTDVLNEDIEFEIKDKECINCEHREPVSLCCCDYCEEVKLKNTLRLAEKKEREFAQKQEALDSIDISPYIHFQNNLLSPKRYIELVAWLRVYWSENQTFIESFNKMISPEQSVYYNFNKTSEMIDFLYTKQIIAFSPTSLHDAFNFGIRDGKFEIESFFMSAVNWELRIDFDSLQDAKRKFIYPDWKRYFTSDSEKKVLNEDEIMKSIVLNQIERLYDFWKELLLEDALDYLKYRYEQVNLAAGAGRNPGLKTKGLLKELLEKFTLGQVYYFIYSGTKDAAAYYQTERVPKAQAANSAITTMERRAQKAEQYNWDISEYDRPWEMSDYSVSHILYHEILKLPNGAKSTIPSINYLLKLFELED